MSSKASFSTTACIMVVITTLLSLNYSLENHLLQIYWFGKELIKYKTVWWCGSYTVKFSYSSCNHVAGNLSIGMHIHIKISTCFSLEKLVLRTAFKVASISIFFVLLSMIIHPNNINLVESTKL